MASVLFALSEPRAAQLRELSRLDGVPAGKWLDAVIANVALNRGVDIPGFACALKGDMINLTIAGFEYYGATLHDLKKLILILHKLATEKGIQAAHVGETLVYFQRRGPGVEVVVETKNLTQRLAKVIAPMPVVMDFGRRVARAYKVMQADVAV